MTFKLTDQPIDLLAARAALADPRAGGYATFEGWVRNRNDGRDVVALEYEAYPALAQTEAEKILAEAAERFDIVDAAAEHRIGRLDLGDVAVWIGVTAVHRGPAFDACQYIINELKVRVPIWKKEHYTDGDSGWVNCEECAKHGHAHGHHH
jgi:molybdopterin synthase catalytic subunit